MRNASMWLAFIPVPPWSWNAVMPILLRSSIRSRAFSAALSRATSPSLSRKRAIAGPPFSAPVSRPLSSFSILIPVGSGVVGSIPIALSAGVLA
jgi:hypothetical protein